jgi:hypothetical protein
MEGNREFLLHLRLSVTAAISRVGLVAKQRVEAAAGVLLELRGGSKSGASARSSTPTPLTLRAPSAGGKRRRRRICRKPAN